MTFVVAALYKFTPLADPAACRAELRAVCVAHGLCGTLLVAPEGINGTVAGSRGGIDALKDFLARDGRFDGMEYKESFASEQPFHRIKVRLKREIVTIGDPSVDPNKTAGIYLRPEDWNALIGDPDTVVIDTRNDYEVEIGTFRNAINPCTKTFSAFPAFVEKNLADKKKKKIAMFCTGGIRCEKASAYMKQAGFEEVYHLKGGILKYLETVPESESLWQGDCFVFDQRVAVGHGLKESAYIPCPSCRRPVSESDRKSEGYVEGVSCPSCADAISADRKIRSAERQKQVLLAQKRGEKHIGARFQAEG